MSYIQMHAHIHTVASRLWENVQLNFEIREIVKKEL